MTAPVHEEVRAIVKQELDHVITEAWVSAGSYPCESEWCAAEGSEVTESGERYCVEHFARLGPRATVPGLDRLRAIDQAELDPQHRAARFLSVIIGDFMRDVGCCDECIARTREAAYPWS